MDICEPEANLNTQLWTREGYTMRPSLYKIGENNNNNNNPQTTKKLTLYLIVKPKSRMRVGTQGSPNYTNFNNQTHQTTTTGPIV